MTLDFDDKAGNAGDVLKHGVLAWLLEEVAGLHIRATYVETHAGRGCHRVNPAHGQRDYLRRPLPVCDDGPCEPMLRVLRRYLHEDAGMVRYPGSPLFAAELLGGAAAGVFFENDPERRASLQDCLARARDEGHAWVRPGAVEENLWDGDAANKLRLVLQQRYGMGATSRPSLVVALVDPFAYVSGRPADVASGEVGLTEIRELSRWCAEVAAGAKVGGGLCAPMSGIVVVWTKGTGRRLHEDLAKLGPDLPQPVAVEALRITRGGERLDYAVVLLGYGATGERLVDKLGRTGEDRVAWNRSALLDTWGFQVSRGL